MIVHHARDCILIGRSYQTLVIGPSKRYCILIGLHDFDQEIKIKILRKMLIFLAKFFLIKIVQANQNAVPFGWANHKRLI